jgi:hypothetical protein
MIPSPIIRPRNVDEPFFSFYVDPVDSVNLRWIFSRVVPRCSTGNAHKIIVSYPKEVQFFGPKYISRVVRRCGIMGFGCLP